MLEQFFDTFGLTLGVLIVLGVGLVVFLLVALVLELRTRKAFPNHEKSKDGESLFDFDDDDDDDDD